MVNEISVQPAMGTRTVCYGENSEWSGVTVGTGTYIGRASIEFGNTNSHVLIGNYCSIAIRVIFEVGMNHDYSYATTYPVGDFEKKDGINRFYAANKNQIIIGNDVWIGCDVIILGGVRIGNGAVIGAGAVVAKDVPPYAVVVGNQARVIKYRFNEEVIRRLQNIKWWYWPYEKIKEKYPLMKDIGRFLQETEDEKMDMNDDETVAALKVLKQNAYHIYYMCADFHMNEQIWHSVLTEYLSKFSQNDRVVLVVEIYGKNVDDYVSQMAKMVNDSGDNAPIVVPHMNNGVSHGMLSIIDTFITTKDESSSVVVDYLTGTDTQIVYGLDFEGHVFG